MILAIPLSLQGQKGQLSGQMSAKVNASIICSSNFGFLGPEVPKPGRGSSFRLWLASLP